MMPNVAIIEPEVPGVRKRHVSKVIRYVRRSHRSLRQGSSIRRTSSYKGDWYNWNQNGNTMKRPKKILKVRLTPKHPKIKHVSIFLDQPAHWNEFKFVEYSIQTEGVENEIRAQFREDYKLPPAERQCATSLIHANLHKNRYPYVYCQDHNRVKLSNGVYFNGNWVDSYDTKDAFICTQAPLPSTSEDFWTMILEYKVKHVLMLTAMANDQINLCSQYWPRICYEQKIYGDIEIKTIQTKEKYNVYVRTLVDVINHKTKMSTRVNHYRILYWPGQGMPDDPYPLNFFHYVIMPLMKERYPIVVHDCDGVGAAPMFIAMDICIQQLEQTALFDIQQTVKLLRTQRRGAISTEDQLVFLYRVLLYHIQCMPRKMHRKADAHLKLLTSGAKSGSKGDRAAKCGAIGGGVVDEGAVGAGAVDEGALDEGAVGGGDVGRGDVGRGRIGRGAIGYGAVGGSGGAFRESPGEATHFRNIPMEEEREGHDYDRRMRMRVDRYNRRMDSSIRTPIEILADQLREYEVAFQRVQIVDGQQQQQVAAGRRSASPSPVRAAARESSSAGKMVRSRVEKLRQFMENSRNAIRSMQRVHYDRLEEEDDD